MYGATIPEDEDAEAILSKLEQAKNQAPARRGFGLVVALCVGVIIGTFGTMALMAGGPEAAMELVGCDSCCEIGITGKITGRSLRSGGCTDLFAIGASREYVRHQGGWGKGYTFDIYDRPSPEQRSYLASKYGTRICNRVISLL